MSVTRFVEKTFVFIYSVSDKLNVTDEPRKVFMNRKEKITLLRKSLEECSGRADEFYCQKDIDNSETYNIVCTIINGYLMELEGKETEFKTWKDKIEDLIAWKVGETELISWNVDFIVLDKKMVKNAFK